MHAAGLAQGGIRAYRWPRMIRFSLFGFPVRIEPFFWVVLVLLGSMGTRGGSREEILAVGLFVVAGFVSILVHELGHAFAGRRFGAHSEITLHSFGGYAAFSGGGFTRSQSFLVTAAGPVLQIFLGWVAYVVFTSGSGLTPAAAHFFLLLALISWVWAGLNLLPVVPLDGGQMLHAALGPERVNLTLWITIITALVSAVMVYKFLGSLIFPIFLGMFAWKAWKALQERNFR
jgi:stage IV sporulation protein FB